MKIEKTIQEGIKRGLSPDINNQENTPLPSNRSPRPNPSRPETIPQRPVDLLADYANGSSTVHPDQIQTSDGDRRSRNPQGAADDTHLLSSPRRRNSMFGEIRRQSAVFFDDTDDTVPSDDENQLNGEKRQ